MANKEIFYRLAGSQKTFFSEEETIDFLTIRVGPSKLEIKEVSGAFDFSAKKLTNIVDGTAAQDAVSKAQLDAQAAGTAAALSAKLSLSGGTMTGPISMGTQKITNLGTPTVGTDATTKTYVDGAITAGTANPSLSNLTTTAINQNLLPSGTRNLGAIATPWNIIYVNEVRTPLVAPEGLTDALVLRSKNNPAGGTVTATLQSGDAGSGASGDVYVKSGTATTTRGKVYLDGLAIDVSGKPLINLPVPTAADEATRKDYVDTADAAIQTQVNGLANKTLSNLTGPTAINQDLLPSGTKALGSSSARWDTAWVQTLNGQNVSVEDSGAIYGSLLPNQAGADVTVLAPIAAVPTENLVGVRLQTADSTDGETTKLVEIRTGEQLFASGDSGDIRLYTGPAPGVRGKIILDASEIDVTSKKVVNLANPTANQDAATKFYVDDQIANAPPSGASTSLNNLIATSINQDLVASVTDVRSIGSSTVCWLGGYFINLYGNLLESKTVGDNMVIQTKLAGTGPSGALQIQTGTTLDGSSNSGSIIIQTGSAAGTGVRGDINFGAANVSISADLSASLIGGTVGASVTTAGAVDLASAPTTISTGTVNSSTSHNSGAVRIRSGVVQTGGGISGDIELETGLTFSGPRGKVLVNADHLDMNSTQVKNVADATASGDAVNKGQLDTRLQNLKHVVEYFTLSAGDITAKKVTLAQNPAVPADTILEGRGFPSQFYTDDYVVLNSNEVDWNGLGLDGLLVAGDKLRVLYWVNG